MAKYYPEFSDAFPGLLSRLEGRSVAVVGHARPDGDCIGSQVALARVLSAHGSPAVCVNPDPVPRRLSYVTAGAVFLGTDQALQLPESTAAVFVDCADHARAGERLKARFAHPVGTVDHHLSNGGFAEVNIVDSASSASCEILAGVFLDAGIAIDPGTATALYAGIVTDTGQFRYSSTSQRSFMLAGELVSRGASPSVAGYELFERESVGKLKLLQHFLASLTMELGGRVCIGTLKQGVYSETGTTAEDTEGLVDFARCVEGVDVGVLVEEKPDGSFRRASGPRMPAAGWTWSPGSSGAGGMPAQRDLTRSRAWANSAAGFSRR